MDEKEEVLRKIAEAWDEAQERFEELRRRVAKAEELAAARVHAAVAVRVQDQAFRDLGEAVWRQVQAGKLSLPVALAREVQRVSDAEKEREAQRGRISDLLQEGEETAQRKSAVETKTKTR